MHNGTPLRSLAIRLARIVGALETKIFFATDLDTVARGWQVRRDAPFTRTYRDPRWDSVPAYSAPS